MISAPVDFTKEVPEMISTPVDFANGISEMTSTTVDEMYWFLVEIIYKC